MGELKVAAKKAFDEKVKEFTTLLLRIRSRFITTMYQDISNDVKEAQLKTSLHYNEKAIQKCYHLIQQIEDEKTRNDLKEFYGDEYQDMIFEEAVKCTDSELSLKIPEREHKEVVDKIVTTEQSEIQTSLQNELLKDYSPPRRNR